MIHFGERIRTSREKMGWSMRELSRRIGVAPMQLHRIETGQNSPRLDIAVKLAKTLRVSLDWLGGVWEEEGKKDG